MVKLGYAVFSVEQRGHGETGGISGFIGKEPYDMMKVIDYIEDNYAFADTERIAILCFSFGGGIGLVLQAFDERVYVEVVYHPLSSLDHITEEIPFENVVGQTRAIQDVNEIKDAFEVCTPTNTKNLLLIQGSADTIIDPNDTRTLYYKLNGPSRTDIDLEIREGIGHPENEADITSFKHAVVWFEHFYHDPTIDITDREEEIKKVNLIDFPWPESPLPDGLILLAAICMFLGLSVILIPIIIRPLYYEHYKTYEEVENELKADEVEERYEFNKLFSSLARYNRMILIRSILYLLPTLLGGILCYVLNWGILYGYFILIPLMTVAVMAFIPSSEHPRWKYEWKHEWNDWYKKHVYVILISVQTIIIPVMVYLFIFNNNAFLMRTAPIPWFNTTALVYFLIPTSMILSDSMLIRGWDFRHTALLAVLRPATLLIFNAFVPFPILKNYGGIFLLILFLSTLGLAVWGLINLFDYVAKTYKSRLTAAMIFVLPYVISVLHWFFRIV